MSHHFMHFIALMPTHALLMLTHVGNSIHALVCVAFVLSRLRLTIFCFFQFLTPGAENKKSKKKL